MLVNDEEFAQFVAVAGAAAVAGSLKVLMDQAATDRPIEAATTKFAADVVTCLKDQGDALDLRTLMAAIHLAGLVLFRATEGRRQLLAGVTLYRLLRDAASRAASYRLQSISSSSPTSREVAGCVCYLATALYRLGGHTRLIEDFIRLAPGYRHVVLVTKSSGMPAEDSLRPGTDCELHLLDEADADEKLRSGLRILNEVAPDVVVALGHPFDPVVGLLTEIYRPAKKVHVHHADHSFSLVPAERDFPVAVLFPGAAEALRRAGVSHVIHLPVTCTDPRSSIADTAASLPAPDEGRFTTATSGSANKFDPRAGADYLELLAMRYAAMGGPHIHFGPLRPDTLQQIDALLMELGRTGDFVQIPFVPYLAAALAAVKPNLYIGSYPMGGKRASIEAMAASCPIAAWQQEGYHSAAEILYPEHLRWRDLDELGAILRGFTREKQDWHAQRSRQWFERNHSEQILRERLLEILAAMTTSGTATAWLREKLDGLVRWARSSRG
jgi:hypothetical protein